MELVETTGRDESRNITFRLMACEPLSDAEAAAAISHYLARTPRARWPKRNGEVRIVVPVGMGEFQ